MSRRNGPFATAKTDEDLEAILERYDQAQARRHRKSHWRVPKALHSGIALLNRLRAAAVQSTGTEALQTLDASCGRALLDWSLPEHHLGPRAAAPPPPPCSTLSGGEVLAVGAICGIVMEARYPENGPHEGIALLLDFAKHGRLGELGITGKLAALLVMLEKKPEWRGRVRRCLYMFAATGKYIRRGCLVYFFDRSPEGNKLGCKGAHGVRVTTYRNSTSEGQYISRKPRV